MKFKIISIGKASEPALAALTGEYQKRISRWARLDWQLIPHAKTPSDESKSILKLLKSDDFVILLDETGQLLTTDQMAGNLSNWIDDSKNLVFIIGGSYGVSKELIDRADFVWSLSKLVFPHQIVRLLLIEQLYRMLSVRGGGKYHH